MSPATPTSPAVSTPGVHLRTGLRPGDVDALSALTSTSRTAVLGTGLMADLLAAGRDSDTVVIVAESADGPLGYVHLDLSAPDGSAWLVSGAVDPTHRRRGIGSALLQAATDAARERGARDLRISGRPHGYAAPGVDADADPGTAAFLEVHGGRPAGCALAMHRTLHDLEPAPRPPEIGIRACTQQDLEELCGMVREHLAADWAETLRAHVEGGGATERILLARSASHELLGVACWGVVGRDPTRFGPFGVSPAARGRGVGGALLDATLLHMAGSGLGHAWFQWTGPDSPAHRLYTSRGFTSLRTFTSYTVPTDHGDVIRAQEGTTR
ncbi:GNAT family N-acetyltransferase [Brachybacterium sp. AOP3-A1-3]|uniref:GNAT family N-acetyltransferase n=1 Tax=Brachybacterium sp. AOP3-A1-3 TaxID=3457699 RepID=UPI0040332E20